jgi:hypothetical protein
MMMLRCLLVAVVLIASLAFASAQLDAADGKTRKRRPEGKRGAKGKPAHSKALQINFPLSHFSSSPRDWRVKATYDASKVAADAANKPWVAFAKAQDQEDVWLYEHYFYGMQKGVVMESGALDGELFSNSNLFEKYADWTAIHVEADPQNYGNLIVNRPEAINVNGALCSEPTLLHYSSFGVIPVRGFVEFMSESFIKKWHGPIYNKRVSIDDLPTVQVRAATCTHSLTHSLARTRTHTLTHYICTHI